MMNIFTTTNKHVLWVEDAQNKPVQVPFMLVQRWGAEPQMIQATVKHFAFACYVMAAGLQWDNDHPKFQEYTHTINWNTDPVHDEARVQIYTNDFPVYMAPGSHTLERVSLNIMTENTSARQVVEGLDQMLTERTTINEICNRLKPANAPQRPVQQQREQSELDKHFGPKQAPPVPPANGLPEGVIAGEVGQPPIIQSWDYKLEDEYNAFFSGKRVAVEIGKVERVIVAKSDGSGSFEVVRMWPFYNGEFPQYCPFPLSFFVDTEPRNFSDWKTFAKDWEPYFPAPGSSHVGRGVATFKVSPSKKEDDDRIFWNFHSLRFDEPFDPPGNGEDVSAHERAEAEGDIPF